MIHSLESTETTAVETAARACWMDAISVPSGKVIRVTSAHKKFALANESNDRRTEKRMICHIVPPPNGGPRSQGQSAKRSTGKRVYTEPRPAIHCLRRSHSDLKGRFDGFPRQDIPSLRSSLPFSAPFSGHGGGKGRCVGW